MSKALFTKSVNGTVSRLKAGNKKAIEPGCEIIVPSKEQNYMSPLWFN